MKYLFCLLPFLLVCCTSKMNIEEQYEETYQLKLKENNLLINSLQNNLNDKISNQFDLLNSKKIQKCDSISKEYFDYLQTVEKEIEINGFEIFFEGDDYSKKGKTYIEESKKYLTEIERLTESENLIERMNLIFNTKEIEPYNDGMYFYYLDYYFKGFPKIQSIAFINDRRKAILEFENELIDELIIRSK